MASKTRLQKFEDRVWTVATAGLTAVAFMVGMRAATTDWLSVAQSFYIV